jgi:hypothetical protein
LSNRYRLWRGMPRFAAAWLFMPEVCSTTCLTASCVNAQVFFAVSFAIGNMFKEDSEPELFAYDLPRLAINPVELEDVLREVYTDRRNFISDPSVSL